MGMILFHSIKIIEFLFLFLVYFKVCSWTPILFPWLEGYLAPPYVPLLEETCLVPNNRFNLGVQ